VLSARRAEIAGTVGKGKTSREIAGILGLSPRTVDTHIPATFRKLGGHSRLGLVATLLKPAPSWPARPAVPPRRSVDAISNNAASKLNPFVGREAETAEITKPPLSRGDATSGTCS
jgi:DNA-binding CsgD family transcriptional regulator